MALSPAASYLFGTMFAGLGVLTLAAPEVDYAVFGLPLEPPGGRVSPVMYAKGVRDLAFGLTYAALQYAGHTDAITVFSGVLCLVALADGWVVWRCGGDRLRHKALVHWAGLVPFVAWLALRVRA